MKLFVYGTLLRGQERAHYLQSETFCGAALCQFALYDLGPYPGMVEVPGQTLGELYSVDPEILKVLDDEEEYYPDNVEGSLYVRKEVRICLVKEGEWDSAQAYIFNGQPANYAPIEHGDYRRYLLETQT